MQTLPEQQKYDPWDAKQEITDIKVLIHCSRYWMLSEWECENMSFPFWRLYHSRTGGSFINFEGREVNLFADKLILIPPNTSFSTRIRNTKNVVNESIKGIKIISEEEIEQYKNLGMCDQFFIHFNLGYPYDKLKPEVFEVYLNDFWQQQISLIEQNRLVEQNTINFQANLTLTGIILYALQSLPGSIWNFPTIDARMLKVMKYIDKNISTELTNNNLSEIANLATNSFARLFHVSLKTSVQQYVRLKRIEKAIMLLHHSDLEIEEISLNCGFYDRHHFSRVFKKQTGFPPVSYRKKIFGM